MRCGERAGNRLSPGSGEEPGLVALVLTGSQLPHLPSHLSVLHFYGRHILRQPHQRAAEGAGRGQAASRRGKVALGLVPRRGQPAQPHGFSDRRTRRRSHGSNCHRDADNAKATLPSLAVNPGLGEGMRDGLRTLLRTQPPSGLCAPASPSPRTLKSAAAVASPQVNSAQKRQFSAETHPAGEPGLPNAPARRPEPLHALRCKNTHCLHFFFFREE